MITRKELADRIDEFPATAKVVVRLPTGDIEVVDVCAEDIVPPDIETNPQGRVINGIVVIFPQPPEQQ